MTKTWLVKFRGETIPYIPRIHQRSKTVHGGGLPDIWLGFDTEAADDKNRPIQIRDEVLEAPAVITMQTHNGNETRLEYVRESADVFRHFWSIIIRSIPEDVFRPLTAKLNTVPVYCHNWGGYDWGMIVKEAPEAWRIQSKLNRFYPGFSDTVIVERSKWRLTIEGGHMSGNAPVLRLIASRKKTGVRLMLLDTLPFFPKSLAAAAKDLGMEKGDRASVIGVDWREKTYGEIVVAKNEKGNLVQVTKQDFEAYAKHDPELVHALGGRIIQMHRLHQLSSLAVSGAGYSAKVMAKSLDAPITGSHGGMQSVQLALDAFHGGRSGRLVHGYIQGGAMYDFRSSYPAIQKRLPVLHPDYTLIYRHRNLPVSEFMRLAKRLHGFARVSGIERDARYPSLLSANAKGSIRPVVGEFHNIPATVAEIYMGVVFGGIELTRISEAVFYEPLPGKENVHPFASFIDTAWREKNAHQKGTIEYDSAKIRANSGFGKMIEHRGANRYVHDDIEIPLYAKGEEGLVQARNFFLQFDHDCWDDASLVWSGTGGVEFRGGATNQHIDTTTLSQLMNADAEFGFYAIPQYATWITGHAHARLVLMMRALDGIKWDTDSVTTLLSEDEVSTRLTAMANDHLPEYIQPLSIGDDLGELDLEAKNLQGRILGNKRYYLEGLVKKNGEWISGAKEGHHGLPGIRPEDIRTVLLALPEAIGDDGKLRYKPRAKPIKMKGARSWDEVGLFVVGSRKHEHIYPNFPPDPKQDFAEGGMYLPFGGFKEP